MGYRQLSRLSAVVVTLMLTACASDPLSLTDSATVGVTSEGKVGLALSPEEVATTGPSVPLNPFADLSSQPIGGREVIANPTLAEILEPTALPEMSFGSADAPVTVVQYASLTCPHCKRFHAEVFPAFKREYIDTGKVRYILRDFPIGRTSGQASVALRCAAPDTYLELYGRFLSEQASWVSQEVRIEPIAAVAAKSGLSAPALEACRNDVKLVEALKSMKDRGRKLGIIGTPNFFIQDKRIKKALDLADLRALIDPLLAAKTASAASPQP